MLAKGRAYKFGDNINTDIIYPGKYLSVTTDREEMSRHCFEMVYPDFLRSAKPGDIIVAGKNFGCGSSREQAATCLKYFGIGAIVAVSCARIFYRNAINLGLPVLIVPDIAEVVQHGENIEVDFEIGRVRIISSGREVPGVQLPPIILNIITAGGLVPYLRKKVMKHSRGGIS